MNGTHQIILIDIDKLQNVFILKSPLQVTMDTDLYIKTVAVVMSQAADHVRSISAKYGNATYWHQIWSSANVPNITNTHQNVFAPAIKVMCL